MPIIDVRKLRFSYLPPRARTAENWTLKDLDFSLTAGGTLGVVGESGSGKSTLIRVLCGLLPVIEGNVVVAGSDLAGLGASRMRAYRRKIQLVYQNPKRSFDPRMKIGLSVSQPVRALESRMPTIDEINFWLKRVGLGGGFLERYPHELSGGQLQRVAIARALSVQPEILLADEPTSALDVSVQAQVLNLISELRDELNLTVVFVSHDLAVVGRVTDKVIVMKHGVIVEAGETANVLLDPAHEYTRKLAQAAQAVSL